jgi:hypothetical protein
MLPFMWDMFKRIWCGSIGFFRSRSSLEAEIVTLRHQLNVQEADGSNPVALINYIKRLSSRTLGLKSSQKSRLGRLWEDQKISE